MGKASPSSSSPLLLDMKSLAGQLSMAFIGIFATAVFGVFVYLVWNVLRKLRDLEDYQKFPYIKLEPSNLPLVGEDQLQPKRNKHEESADGYSSSFALPWGHLPSRESSRMELASFDTVWSGSPQYPQRAWN